MRWVTLSSGYRNALTTYMISLIKSYLLSPTMYIGLSTMSIMMGLIGARGAHMPIAIWFSMTYPLFGFSMTGVITRSTLIEVGAFNYLTRHGGVSPVKLIITIVLANTLIQVVTAPLFTVLLIAAYYLAGVKLGALGVTPMFLPAIFFLALFTSALGIAAGLITAGRALPARLMDFMPSLFIPLFLFSLFTPDNLRPYNPFTAIMTLLTASLSTVTSPNTGLNLLISYATLSITILALLALSLALARRVREVNVYDISLGL